MFTPTTCGVWHVDQVTSTTAAERFVAAHCRMLKMQSGNWRCWLRKLPQGDDRAGRNINGLRFYGSTEHLAIWEAATWLYRSWRTPEASLRSWTPNTSQTSPGPR